MQKWLVVADDKHDAHRLYGKRPSKYYSALSKTPIETLSLGQK
jgi:hypothetical protein